MKEPLHAVLWFDNLHRIALVALDILAIVFYADERHDLGRGEYAYNVADAILLAV